MPDHDTTLDALKKRVLQFARERDWEQFHTPKNLSMALSAEAAELMEHFLWCSTETSQTLASDPLKAAKIKEELADVVIYALEFANITGIDLSEAIKDKMAMNALKYPVDKAKGTSLKYDEL